MFGWSLAKSCDAEWPGGRLWRCVPHELEAEKRMKCGAQQVVSNKRQMLYDALDCLFASLRVCLLVCLVGSCWLFVYVLIVFSFPATCNLKFQSALDCGRLSQPSCGSRFYQQSVPTKGIETGQAMIVKSLQLKACWENNFFDNKYNFPAFDGDFVCVRLSSVIPKTTLLFLKSPSYQARCGTTKIHEKSRTCTPRDASGHFLFP